MPASVRIARPSLAEHGTYYRDYVASVPGDDAMPVLVAQAAEVEGALGGLSEVRALHRYAPGKWSVKEVLGHLCDCERIFSYRALRFARGDATPLPSFEETAYVPAGRFDARPMRDLVEEFHAVRAATLALYRSLDAEALTRTGVANDNRLSVRGIAWVTAGHLRHHRDVLRDRYGVA